MKWITDNDPNDDHNRALEQLLKEASASISADERLFTEARRDSTKLLELIVESFGYNIVTIKTEIEEA